MDFENNEMRALADNLWAYMRPKVQEMLSSTVRFYRAQVVSAASNGKITVKRPFDDASIALPYVQAMEDAPAGSQVTVLVFGSTGEDANNSVIVNDGEYSK